MFNIQLFAEGAESGVESQVQSKAPNVENNDAQESTEPKQETKPEIDIDAKIADAISRAQKSFEELLAPKRRNESGYQWMRFRRRDVPERRRNV